MENQDVGGAKNALQELCAGLGMKEAEMPVYKDISESGPPHCKQFTVECIVAGISCLGIASNKKQASKLAAAKVFKELEHLKPKTEREKKSVMSILMFDKADSIVGAVKIIFDIRQTNECFVILDDGITLEADYATVTDRCLQLMFESGMTDLSAWERIINCIKASAKESDIMCNYDQGDSMILFKKNDGSIKFEYTLPFHYDSVIKLCYGNAYETEENGHMTYYVRCSKDNGEFSYDALNTNLCELRDGQLGLTNQRRILYVHDKIHDDMDIDFKQLRKLMYSIFIKCKYSFKAMDSRLNQSLDRGCEIEPTVIEYA
uniref:VP8 n=1 Tax=viral metagenome TaxID=1070528 RepID=A0A2V0R9N6_9ZZZZ